MDGISSTKIQQCFSAAMATYNTNAVVQRHIVEKLTALLSPMDIERCLEIGCGTGSLTQSLHQHLWIKQWDIVDLCDCIAYLTVILPAGNFQFYQRDAECFSPPHRYDLIASASTLQWFRQKSGFITNCAANLKKNGYLLFSTFGENNLLEIKHLTGIGLDYPSLAQWRQWLEPDFDILHLSQEQISLTFDDPHAVLRHLQATGVTATARQSWTKQGLQDFVQNYEKNYRTLNGGVSLTYHPIYVLARCRGDELIMR